jgi:hypothetical protein
MAESYDELLEEDDIDRDYLPTPEELEKEIREVEKEVKREQARKMRWLRGR